MAAFNQPDRTSTVCKRDDSGSITQALEMMNGDRINGAVKGASMITQILNSKLNAQQAAQELFLSVLTRNPSPTEAAAVINQLHATMPTREWIEDVYWALLNTARVYVHKVTSVQSPRSKVQSRLDLRP